jgi:hypothetical protein
MLGVNKMVHCMFHSFQMHFIGIVAGRRRLATAEILCRASWCEVLCVGKGFRFNHKIMINIQESPPSIMVTRNLWSARVWVRDWLCKEKTHHPQCTLPKVSCIVVWLFFLSRVSIRWSFLRLKADLSSWESLYLIGLNLNRSKVWILALHLFTPCIFNTWGCTLSCNFTPHKY